MYKNGEDRLQNVESLGWDDLVSMKRKLSTEIRDLTNNLMNIENNQFRIMNETIREQKINLNNLVQQSKQDNINKSLKELYEQETLTQVKIAEADDMVYKLVNSKRSLSSNHERFLMEYDRIISQLDIVNARLNVMAEMRERQRQEYGRGLPN